MGFPKLRLAKDTKVWIGIHMEKCGKKQKHVNFVFKIKIIKVHQ